MQTRNMTTRRYFYSYISGFTSSTQDKSPTKKVALRRTMTTQYMKPIFRALYKEHKEKELINEKTAKSLVD